MLNQRERMVVIIGAVLCFTLAGWLIVWAGIPQRADFTGTVLESGIRVAPEIGALAPPFDLAAPDGEPVRLSDFQGRVVIVNFWATWCEPCKVEMPELQRLYVEAGGEGLQIIGVNTGEPAALVRGWRETFGLTFPLVLDPDGAVSELYRLRGQPSTYVIDRTGMITHIFYGPVDFGTLRQALSPG